MLIRSPKKLYLSLIALIVMACFLSCHKDINDNSVPAGETPDLSTKIISSVSGFVTDENNVPLQGALVKVGTAAVSMLTDQYGYFEATNVEVVKTAAVVTITKTSYFKGIKTWAATTGISAFFRIKLLPKVIAGTINSSSGGNISLSNGLIIAIPSNGVVKAAGNSVYTGNINVAVSWLDPEANDLDQIMPGDLRGIDDAGSMKGLTTFGMAAVELTNDAGELLQIAAGKKATITMPLSATASANAPVTIPLWYFNESNGLWKQEGTATKTGNTYVGDVSHFSWWNCDFPNSIVPLTFTVINGNGTPFANAHVEIKSVAPNTWYHACGWTDATGFVDAKVPPNMSYTLNVFGNCNNVSVIFSQQFSIATTAIGLGDVVVPSANLANVSGSITDCNGYLVTNGTIVLMNGYNYTRYATDNTGAFNFSTSLCSGSMYVELVAEDNNALSQSAPTAYTLTIGTNAIGNLQACVGAINEYIHYNIDGIDYAYDPPGDTIESRLDVAAGEIWITANSTTTGNTAGDAAVIFQPDGMALNDSTELFGFFLPQVPSGNGTIINNWSHVTLTEFGAIGDYMSGNFSANYTVVATGITHSLTLNFRVRRPG